MIQQLKQQRSTQGTKHKTIFISTGEVSGDLQAGLLVEALKRQATIAGLELDIVALGGDRVVQAGAKLLGNTSGIGSMGILEAIPHVLPTLQVQRRAKQYLQEHSPDLVVAIDYMGPNLTIGKYIRQQLPDVPIVYYITPQLWVWSAKPGDTERVMGMSDRIIAIFPEEARFFKERGAQVTYLGHPLVDRMQDFPSREAARTALGIAPNDVAIALLPASRHQEIKYLLPTIFQAAREIQNHFDADASTQNPVHFWIPLSLEAYRSQIEAAIKDYGLRATLVANQTKEVLAAADLAITKSGTVNLELALLDVPQVVLYRLSAFTYWIARKILKFSIPFMSPPNLVAMKPIVPELLQEQATVENIVRESLELLLNPERRQQTLKDYQEMRHYLGEVGVCDRVAQDILQMLI